MVAGDVVLVLSLHSKVQTGQMGTSALGQMCDSKCGRLQPAPTSSHKRQWGCANQRIPWPWLSLSRPFVTGPKPASYPTSKALTP